MALDPLISVITKLERLVKSRGFYLRLGEKARDIVYKRAKAGGGVSSDTIPNPSPKKLAALGPSYITFRRGVKLGSFGAPGRSNATLSGQMLDALTVEAKRFGFEVFIKDNSRSDIQLIPKRKSASPSNRSKSRNPRKSIPQNLTNAQVYQFYREQRPFLGLTRDEQRIIVREIRRAIQLVLK